MTAKKTDKPIMDWLDCFCTTKAICPWCGHEDPDSWEYGEGETDVECPSCRKPFTVEVTVSVEYTTEPKGGWPDDR